MKILKIILARDFTISFLFFPYILFFSFNVKNVQGLLNKMIFNKNRINTKTSFILALFWCWFTCRTIRINLLSNSFIKTRNCRIVYENFPWKQAFKQLPLKIRSMHLCVNFCQIWSAVPIESHRERTSKLH